jgi:sulfate/thiosulfate transport system substrate-binding protein
MRPHSRDALATSSSDPRNGFRTLLSAAKFRRGSMRSVLALTAARSVAACGVITLIASIAGCSKHEPSTAGSEYSGRSGESVKMRTLTLGAYTTPREAYGKAILPAFREYWRNKTGEELRVNESYLGSGAQSRAILAGFEADVATLSLEPDIEKIAKAGLITHDWKKDARGGMVTRSIVVIGVRPGNPKNIHSWLDLARPDVNVLTPNVKTSGGAMWNVLALVGAAQRGKIDGVSSAEKFLGSVIARVGIMDKGARESMITFESGAGDAIVTYENELLVARDEGQKYEAVVPGSTIRIDNPIAVVDTYATKHGNLECAREFVAFALRPESQEIFAHYGLRPVDDDVAKKVFAQSHGNFATPADLFTIEDLGGWSKVETDVFAKGGLYDRAAAGAAAAK